LIQQRVVFLISSQTEISSRGLFNIYLMSIFIWPYEAEVISATLLLTSTLLWLWLLNIVQKYHFRLIKVKVRVRVKLLLIAKNLIVPFSMPSFNNIVSNLIAGYQIFYKHTTSQLSKIPVSMYINHKALRAFGANILYKNIIQFFNFQDQYSLPVPKWRGWVAKIFLDFKWKLLHYYR
jgi:hypothetical protein